MTEERKFGLVVGGAFVLLGLGLAWASPRPFGPVLVAAGCALLLSALVAPPVLAPLRRGWMALARALGRVNSVVFLSLVFFLILAPLGVLLRLAGRDELDRKRRGSSSWVPYPARNRDPRHFEKMF